MIQLLYVTVFGLGLLTIIARPYLLLRPSMWVSMVFCVCISGAAAFGSDYVNGRLVCYEELRVLTVIFPIPILLWTIATPGLSRVSRSLYSRCRYPSFGVKVLTRPERFTVLIVAVFAGAIIAGYLNTVPLRNTGLYAIFLDPANSAMARENSLKLLSSQLVKYAYSMHLAVLAPILFALIANSLSWRPNALNCMRSAVLGLVLVSVILTGARAPAAAFVLLLGIICLLRYGIFSGGLALMVAAPVGVVAVTIHTILREGHAITLSMEMLKMYLIDGLLGRILVAPFKTGLWTNLYAQEFGLVGFSSIRPLALLVGVEFIDMPNLVGLAYAPPSLSSISCGTCFLFDCQASFGLVQGWLISAVLLCSLDSLLILFSRLNGALLVSLISAFLLSLLSLTSAAFTPSLLSHGIVPIAMLALGCGLIFRVSLLERICYGVFVRRASLSPSGSASSGVGRSFIL